MTLRVVIFKSRIWSKNIIYKIFDVWALSGKGKYMATCTSQLVEFFGERVVEFWIMSYSFLINIGLNNYLKVTNVERNEPGASIATQS